MSGRKKREDTTVKIATRVYIKAKRVATYRDLPLAEYLTDLLEKLVDRDYGRMREAMNREDDIKDEGNE